MERSLRRWLPVLLLAACGALLAASCTVGQKKKAFEGATANEGSRRELFEATLRALDDKPEYVDEFFATALKLPRTLDRFVHDTVQRLRDAPLARTTARELAAAPPSLEQVMIQTLEASRNEPAARQAIARAIAKLPDVSALVITERPETLERSMVATIDAVVARDAARPAFRAAMEQRGERVARLVVEDKGTAGKMMKDFARAGVTPGKDAREAGVQ